MTRSSFCSEFTPDTRNGQGEKGQSRTILGLEHVSPPISMSTSTSPWALDYRKASPESESSTATLTTTASTSTSTNTSTGDATDTAIFFMFSDSNPISVQNYFRAIRISMTAEIETESLLERRRKRRNLQAQKIRIAERNRQQKVREQFQALEEQNEILNERVRELEEELASWRQRFRGHPVPVPGSIDSQSPPTLILPIHNKHLCSPSHSSAHSNSN